jgi:hypothetical protein
MLSTQTNFPSFIEDIIKFSGVSRSSIFDKPIYEWFPRVIVSK